MTTKLVQVRKRTSVVSVKETEQRVVRWKEGLISWPDQVQSQLQLKIFYTIVYDF